MSKESKRQQKVSPKVLAKAIENSVANNKQRDIVEVTAASRGDYREFFKFYADFVGRGAREGFLLSLNGGIEGKNSGFWFQPLGWIPGEAVVLHFKWGKVRLIDATAKAKMSLPRPSEEYREIKDLPKLILDHLEEWRLATQALGNNPSPWSLGFTSTLLKGEIPRDHLTIFFPRLRLGQRDPEIPLGISLIPGWGGFTVKVYNPTSWQGPGVPKDDEILSVEDLLGRTKKAREKWQREHVASDALAKLLLTAARMEGYSRETRNHD